MANCEFCGREVVPPPTEPVIGSPDDPEIVALLRKVGRRCHKCGKVSCQPCAYKAARKRGNRHFTCPKCGANIHENPLDAPQQEGKPWWQRLFGGTVEEPERPTPSKAEAAPPAPTRASPAKESSPAALPPATRGEPELVVFLVDRHPPWGRETHVQRALQGLAPGVSPRRAILQVNPDHQNPMLVGVVATMVARQHGFEADLEKLRYQSYQSADGISGTMVTIFRK